VGPAIELPKSLAQDADSIPVEGDDTATTLNASGLLDPAQSNNPRTVKNNMHENPASIKTRPRRPKPNGGRERSGEVVLGRSVR